MKMKMKDIPLCAFFVSMHLILMTANGQLYDSYSKHMYLKPINFSLHSPQIVQYSNVDPLDVSSVVPSAIPLNTPRNIQNAGIQISRGSEQFSVDMIRAIADAVNVYDVNFIIAPFSIWSLMTLVAEGANGETFNQLEKVLRLPNNLEDLRMAYQNFQRLLLVNTSTVELAVNQAVFSDKNHLVSNEYARVLSNEYHADHLPVDFLSTVNAANTINSHVNLRTRGKISEIVKPDDLINAQLLLTSSIFFKGQWKFPFNTSLTNEQPFYRENGDYLAHVRMMDQKRFFPYARIDSLQAHVVKLPYGEQDRLSMILMLPLFNTTLCTVFDNLRKINVSTIHHELHKNDNNEEFVHREVALTLPKFNIDSDLELRTVFQHLGITDVFDAAKANLSKMSNQPMAISRVFHKAIIQVNEEGTVAAAVTGGISANREFPLQLVFNRPFAFLITDRSTNTLLFAGQVRNPLAG